MASTSIQETREFGEALPLPGLNAGSLGTNTQVVWGYARPHDTHEGSMGGFMHVDEALVVRGFAC